MQTYAPPPPPTRRRRLIGGERPGPFDPPTKRDPMWAKLCMIIGAAVMVLSGAVVVVPKLVAAWATNGISQVKAIPEELRGTDINGPINVLLLGLDERDESGPTEPIRADSIMIVHIPATHDRVFMVSIPRDSSVEIPDYPKANFKGFRTKVNAAFAFGATKNGKRDDSPEGRARGAELTIKTLNKLVPGLTFNAVAVINFDGFDKIVEVLGSVHMCVDEDTYSIHYLPNGDKAWDDLPDGYGYHYPVGCRDMLPWQALDYARQRHIDGGDYARQRHQQQLMKAIVSKIASSDTLANFNKVKQLQAAAGNLLTLDLGGVGLEDWAFTLQSLRANDMVLIKTNGGQLSTIPGTSDEAVTPETMKLLKSVQSDTVFDFLTQHPDWIASAQ